MKFFYSFFSAVVLAALLFFVYAGNVQGQTPQQIDVQISASTDDAHEAPICCWPGYSHTSGYIYAGAPGSGGSAVYGGWRWTGLAIPAGSTILEAYAQFNQSFWGNVIPTTLSFENKALPFTFSSISSPADRWADKTAFGLNWTWSILSPGAWITSPSLTAGIQELVNTHGDINQIVLLESKASGQGLGYHYWTSYDNNPLAAAKLHIVFDSGLDTVPPVRSNPQPAGVLPVGTASAILSLDTNENAQCRYATTPDVGYSSMVNVFQTTGTTAHSTQVTGLENGGVYAYYVKCEDVSLNANPDDFLINFSVDVPDTTPPGRSSGQPTGTLPHGTSSTSISLATNETATCKYDTVPGTSFSAMSGAFAQTGGLAHSTVVAGLSDGNNYNYYIRCQDALNNANPDDFVISFSVLTDTISPVRSSGQPAGTLGAGTASATVSLITDENATCKYSATAGTAYSVMAGVFGTTGLQNHSFQASGLQDGTAYSYHVRCEDGLGNQNTSDYTISFSIANPGPVIIDAQISASFNDAYRAPVCCWPWYSQTDGSIFAGAPGPGNSAVYGGWRWTGLSIPADAQIIEAYVQLNQNGYGYVIPTTLSFENAKTPGPFSSWASPFDRWSNRTLFELNWTWPKQNPGAWIQTPSLTSGIQEVLNTHGAINELVLLEDGSPATVLGGYHAWVSYDGTPALAAKLHVEYSTNNPPPDTTPPVVSQIGVIPSTTTAIVSWTTNEPAASQVEYGLDQNLGTLSTFDATLQTNHIVTLSGLTPGTFYYYKVKSQDTFGNETIAPAAPNTFQTLQETASFSVNAVAGDGQVGLTWDTSEGATYYIVKRGTNSSGPFIYIGETTAIAFTDYGLVNGISYFHTVTAANAAGEGATAGPTIAVPQGGEPVRALFVGNSYTQFNGSVYNHVVAFGANDAPAANIQVSSSHIGGSTLQVQWQTGTAQSVIQQGNWDYVVLQDYWWADSNFPPDYHEGEWFRTYSQLYDDLIKQYNPQAKTVLFATWVYGEGAKPTALVYYQDMQEYVNWAYADQARNLNSMIAPAGRAFQRHFAQPDPTIELYSDGSHPNDHGTYLASAVMYATITGRNPVGNPYISNPSISPSQAAYLQQIAWDEVSANTAHINVSNIQASGIGNTATITWQTDTPTTTQVFYGISPSLGSLSVFDASLTTSHSADLQGITQGITYYYKVVSEDNSENRAIVSADPLTFVIGVPQLARGPYLQNSTQTQMTIAWTTNVAGDSVVEYGIGGLFNQQASDPAQTTAHAVSLSGLTAGTTYDYRIKTNNNVLATSTLTANKTSGNFSFAFFADSGDGSAAQQAIASQAAVQPLDFILHGGDVVYPSGADADYDTNFFPQYGSIIDNIPFYSVLGNHDVQTANGQPYLDIFSLPTGSSGTERYYSFDYANAHFAALDTNSDFSTGSAQKIWLESDLSSTTKDWKIVFFHHPPYTIGPHASDAIVTTLQNQLVPLFEQYNVDMVLGGHDHIYTRSNPINGVTYIVSGAGGAELYSAAPDTFTASYLNTTHSFSDITINGLTLTLSQIKGDGTIFETHVINK